MFKKVSKLKQIDLFGRRPELSMRGSKSHKTWCGSVCTVFIFIACLVSTIYYGQLFFDRKNPQFMVSETLDVEGVIVEKDYEILPQKYISLISRDFFLIFTISNEVESVKVSGLEIIVSVYAGSELKYSYSSTSCDTSNRFQSQILDSSNRLSTSESLLDDARQNADRYYCLGDSELIESAIPFVYESQNRIEIAVTCNDVSSECNSLSNMQLTVLYVDSLKSPTNFDSPLIQYIRREYIPIDSASFDAYEIVAQKIQFITDSGYFYEEKTAKDQVVVADFKLKKSKVKASGEPLLTLNLVPSPKRQIFDRYYPKILTLVGLIGGILKSLMVVGSLLTKPFSKLSMRTKLVNQLFTFEIQNEKANRSQFQSQVSSFHDDFTRKQEEEVKVNQQASNALGNQIGINLESRGKQGLQSQISRPLEAVIEAEENFLPTNHVIPIHPIASPIATNRLSPHQALFHDKEALSTSLDYKLEEPDQQQPGNKSKTSGSHFEFPKSDPNNIFSSQKSREEKGEKQISQISINASSIKEQKESIRIPSKEGNKRKAQFIQSVSGDKSTMLTINSKILSDTSQNPKFKSFLSQKTKEITNLIRQNIQMKSDLGNSLKQSVMLAESTSANQNNDDAIQAERTEKRLASSIRRNTQKQFDGILHDKKQKSLILNIKDYANYFLTYCFGFVSKKISQAKNETVKQMKYTHNKVKKRFDIIYILEKLIEIDKLKVLLLNSDQINLFDYMPKEFVQRGANSYENQLNIHSKNNKFATWSLLCAEKSSLDKYSNACIAYHHIQENPRKTKIDQKLLQMLDPQVKRYFSNAQILPEELYQYRGMISSYTKDDMFQAHSKSTNKDITSEIQSQNLQQLNSILKENFEKQKEVQMINSNKTDTTNTQNNSLQVPNRIKFHSEMTDRSQKEKIKPKQVKLNFLPISTQICTTDFDLEHEFDIIPSDRDEGQQYQLSIPNQQRVSTLTDHDLTSTPRIVTNHSDQLISHPPTTSLDQTNTSKVASCMSP